MTIETQEGPRTRTPRRSDGMAAVGASPTPPRAQHVPAGPHLGLGTKVQRCTVCEEVFTSPKSGDKHRVIAGHYDLIRIDGKLVRVGRESGEPVVPDGGVLVSQGNQIRRCLTPDEMRARGLVLNGQGRWSTPGGEWQPRLEVTP